MDNVVLDTNAALPILHLNGTAYENGLQHGKLLQQEIHALVGLWKQDLAEKYQLPADTFITRFLNSTNYIPAIEKWTPELLDEVKGISQGAGMEFNTLFAFQLIDEIWTNGKFINNAHHCTSVGINNYKKDGSSNFIAQNIDVTPFYHGFEVLLDIQDRKSGTRKLVTTFAGYIGINGINRQIGVTENSLTALKSAKDGLPVCFVSRGILEKKSFDEAVSFVKQVKHASGQNYTIGSTHHIISLECAADLITEYWPDSSKLYTFHANRPLTNTSYHASYVDLSHVYGIDHRFETMKNKLLNQKSIGLATIKDALATKPICNTNTFASTIMEFHTDYSELHIASGNLDSLAYMQLRIDK
ncbi:MAG: C45 family autoproteolytic acyltransferase/hydrolase [Flammeovirgaceae bacterium]